MALRCDVMFRSKRAFLRARLDLELVSAVSCFFLQAQASKTREVVAQQRVLVQLEEQSRASAASIEAAKAKRDKVRGFLRVRSCSVGAMCSLFSSCLRGSYIRSIWYTLPQVK